MIIKLQRTTKGSTFTGGKLYINDVYFCDTLEDVDRGLSSEMTSEEISKIKVFGKTAIPTGTYQVIVNWSTRFAQYMPLFLNVKGFLGVRAHSGNTSEDTEGCVLVGNYFDGKLTNSRKTAKELFKIIQTASKKEKIIIFVTNDY